MGNGLGPFWCSVPKRARFGPSVKTILNPALEYLYSFVINLSVCHDL